MPVPLIINGHPHHADVDPDTRLIYVLRNDLKLVGAKLGCGLEQCGSCLVHVDGEPVYSCTTAIAEVAHKRIDTVEGLAAGDELHPVQQAFLDENAAQCGYCTAGIIMRTVALLRHNPAPTRAEITSALDPHLCRCGAHPRILRAVERAAAAMRTRP